jgi:hypothetical protein
MLRAIDRWSVKRLLEQEHEVYLKLVAGLPQRKVGRVTIHGSDAFLDDVSDALRWLETGFPYGFSLVQRYIRAVVAGKPRRGAQPTGVWYIPTTAGGRVPSARNRFAAVLVSFAVSTRIILHYLPTKSRAQVVARRWERRAMELLNCHPLYLRRQAAHLEAAERRYAATK